MNKRKTTNRKAVELSLNFVIIGVILLIVMAIVIFIFASGANKQNSIIGGFLDETNKSAHNPNDDEGIVNKYLENDDDSSQESIPPLVLAPLMLKRRKEY